jgi:TP901 family phage tail tape measure protein
MTTSRDEIIRILLQTGGIDEARKLRDELSGIVDTSGRAANSSGVLASRLGDLKVSALAAVGAVRALGGQLADSVRAAADFEDQLAQISTLGTDPRALAAIREEAERLAGVFGGAARDQLPAFYQAISAGFTGAAEASAVVDAANKVAAGGAADLTESVNGITAALNAFGLGADQAEAVADQFFSAVRDGKTTITELNPAIGQLGPLAKQLGVELNTLLPALASLTQGGLNTSAATTQLRAALAAVVKPTAEASRTAAELGIQFDAAALRTQGLAGFLDSVSAAAAGNEAALGKLFSSSEALLGVLTLTGAGADSFATALRNASDAAGLAGNAAALAANTASGQAARFEAATDRLSRSFGELLNNFAPVLEVAAKGIDAVSDLIEPLDRAAGSMNATATATFLAREALDAYAKAGDKARPGALENVIAARDSAKAALEDARAQLARAEAFQRIPAALRQFEDLDPTALAEFRQQLVELEIAVGTAEGTVASARGEFDAWRTSGEAVATALGGEWLARVLGFEAAVQRLADTAEAAGGQAGAGGGVGKLAEGLRELGIAGDLAGEKITAAGGKILTALDNVLADARATADQIGAALQAGIGKISTSAEIEELGARLSQAFEEGRLSASRFADLTLQLADRQRALQADVRNLTGAYEASDRAAQAAVRARIAQLEGERQALATIADDIATKLGTALAKFGENSPEVDALRNQFQGVDQQIQGLNGQLQQTQGQLGKTGEEGTRRANQLATGLVDVSKGADAARESVAGAFNRVGAAQALRDAITLVAQEFYALSDAAGQFFETTLLDFAQGERSILGVFDAINRAQAQTRAVYDEQAAAAERQASSFANLSEDAIARLAATGTSAEALEARAGRLSRIFDLLGDQDLSGLRSALATAAGQLRGLEAEADSAVAALERMNGELEKARLREAGDEKALADLELKERLREIDELAAAAGVAGQETARRNRELAETEHRRRLEEIAAESSAARAAARERSRESAGGTGTGSGGQASTGGSGRGSANVGTATGTPVIIHVNGQQFGLSLGGPADVSTLQRMIALLRRDAMASGYGGSVLR